jgi:hypothetical protein
MSLIEYVEPANVGDFFVGIGSLILACVLAYILYRIYIKVAHWIDVMVNREAKYELLEETMLDKIAKDKGINLNEELAKRKIFDIKHKSFRKKIEEKVYEEMFGKSKEKK